MAVRTREELLESVKNVVGDSTSEEVMTFIEDVTDTYDDLASKTANSGDWERKYNELSVKYKERFFETGKIENNPEDNTDPDPDDYVAPERYEDLFTTVEE
jgi:hypothetical protein